MGESLSLEAFYTYLVHPKIAHAGAGKEYTDACAIAIFKAFQEKKYNDMNVRQIVLYIAESARKFMEKEQEKKLSSSSGYEHTSGKGKLRIDETACRKTVNRVLSSNKYSEKFLRLNPGEGKPTYRFINTPKEDDKFFANYEQHLRVPDKLASVGIENYKKDDILYPYAQCFADPNHTFNTLYAPQQLCPIKEEDKREEKKDEKSYNDNEAGDSDECLEDNSLYEYDYTGDANYVRDVEDIERLLKDSY